MSVARPAAASAFEMPNLRHSVVWWSSTTSATVTVSPDENLAAARDRRTRTPVVTGATRAACLLRLANWTTLSLVAADSPLIETDLPRWDAAHERLVTFLDSLGVTNTTHTVALKLRSIPITSPDTFVDWLQSAVNEEDHWGYVIGQSPSGSFALAARLADDAPDSLITRMPFLDVHTWLVAWWLMTSWRARELAAAGRSLVNEGSNIAACACVRALVETAASFVADTRKMSDAWNVVKSAGSMDVNATADVSEFSKLSGIVAEIVFGSKFVRAESFKQTLGAVQRTNVLGHLEKLGKAVGGPLVEDYELLCNTVHPSIGNTLVYGSVWLAHETGTHAEVWLSGKPLELTSLDGSVAENPMRLVQPAIARTATVALEVLATELDACLRMIDDVALTTKAPMLSRRPYWRNLRVDDPQGFCPCRSGRSSQDCSHTWGTARHT